MTITKGENLKVEGIVVLLYGEPGIGKTSTSLNTKNPIIFDFDGGVQRSEFKSGKSVVRINSWKEIDSDLPNLEKILKPYDNIIIDTVDNCLSFMRIYLEDSDFKLKKNQLQMYGKMKDLFDNFLKRITRLNKNVILVAHSSTEEIDGKIKSVPKITGGSKDLVKSLADFIGYCFSENNKKCIDFNPTDYWYGKNSAKFERFVVPDFHEDSLWFESKLILMKNALMTIDEEQEKILNILKIEVAKIQKIDNKKDLVLYINTIEDFDKTIKLQLTKKAEDRKLELELLELKNIIDLFTDAYQFNELMNNLKNYESNVKAQIWLLLKSHSNKINIKFNPDLKQFEDNYEIPFGETK